jgi:hypothetical protein
MSVATYIASIEASRNSIRNKLVELGMAQSVDKLDVLAQAIVDIVNQGAVSVEIKEGTSYTIPAGYHNGSGTVKAISDAAGDAEAYKTQAKTVTPTKKQQSVTPDAGYYALESVTVNAIPTNYQDTSSVTAGAADVLTGKVFVTADGVVTPGDMVNNGAVDKTLDATTVTYTIPKGFHSGSGKVKLVLETKSVTPTKSAQEVTPTAGNVLSKVTVGAIPDKYQDVSGVTTTAPNVLDGTYFVDKTGELVEGTMPDKGAVNATIDGLTTTSYTIPAGKHNGSGKVTLTSDIENALAAI